MRHLVLVGLMGAGKTTVGRICAEKLGRAFVDTDEIVEAIARAPVAEIFATDGESTFREWETQAVADACASPEPLVISCGGGAVMDPTNRRRLRETGFVVWLRAPADVLRSRVGEGGGRPLLESGVRSTLERLAVQREGAYSTASHASVATDCLDPEAVAEAVLALWPERPGPQGQERRT